MSFKIALVQFKPERKNVRSNVTKLQQLLYGITADLIVLPELSNTGYLYEYTKDLAPFAEPSDGSGEFVQALTALAVTTQGVIISGYAEISDGKLFNSAVAVSAHGVIHNYRKIHLYADEKMLFQPGDHGLSTFSWAGVEIGIMICFDWIFPEAARTLALAGAQIIAHPANLVLPYCQNAMITRSIENKVFTITANRIGKEHVKNSQLTFTGASQMTAPSGELLFRGPKNTATVHITEIDPQQALNKRISVKNDLFSDRRPAFYTD